MLLKNGFSGNEVCIPDYSDTRHTFSAIISTALEKDSDGGTSQKTLIIANQQSSLQRQVAQDVTASLRSIGIPDSEVVSMQHIQSRDLKDTLCICLLEIVEPFLAQLNDEDFEALKILVASASGLLWVTQGCGELSKRPGLALVTGFGRAVCSENWNINFVELALELKSSPTQVLSQITKVYQKCLLSPTAQSETEYMEKDGKLCISRVVEANNLNNSVHAKLCKQQPEIRSIGQEPKRALSLQIATPGLLDTLQFEDDDLFEQPMAADEVEIEVKAIGVNFKDVMIALGRLPSDSIGFECAGVVKRAGNTGLRVGDRVCCCAKSGAFKTLVRAQRTAVAKIPDGVSFRSAAALPVVFCTAYYSLIHVARLTEGESILIHSGAGGVGQAAIQIARGLKAKIFTTVGTAEKKRFLLNAYGIPEDHIFSSRDASFTRGITRLTKGAGVDVVLNSLSDENLRASWSCIATFGRFIELGKTDIQSRNALPMDPFARGATFTSVDLGLVMDKARPLMETMMKRVMTLVTDGESGISPPQPLQVYSVSKLEEAFRLMQSGKSMGKIVIEMDETARVPVFSPASNDRPNANPARSFQARNPRITLMRMQLI